MEHDMATMQELFDQFEPLAAEAAVGIATRLETMPSDTLSNIATVSLAISAKRIADALETITFGNNDYAGLLGSR